MHVVLVVVGLSMVVVSIVGLLLLSKHDRVACIVNGPAGVDRLPEHYPGAEEDLQPRPAQP